jgi:hypothetical protein
MNNQRGKGINIVNRIKELIKCNIRKNYVVNHMIINAQ